MGTASCPQCGSDALATVLSKDDSGEHELRSYCRECQKRGAELARAERRPLAAAVARLLVYGGLLLALLTATADYLGVAGRTGFGWRQMAGTELGFLAVVIGLFLRKGMLVVAGLFLVPLSIGADLLHVGHVPGFGWRSQVGFLVATVMLAAGIFWRRALARAASLRVRD